MENPQGQRGIPMKKVVPAAILVPILAAVLLAAVGFRLGTLAEKHYFAFLKRTSESPYLKCTGQKYDRGIFTSHARTEIEIVPREAFSGIIEEPLRFTLLHEIHHGPFPFGAIIENGMSWKPVMGTVKTVLQRTADSHGGIDPIEVMQNHTVLHLTGDGVSRFSVAPYRYVATSENREIRLTGMDARLDFAPDFKTVSGTVNVPEAQTMGSDGTFAMKGFRASFEFHEGTTGLPIGRISMTIDAIDLDGPVNSADRRLQVKVVGIAGAAGESGAVLQSSLTMHVDRMSLGKDPCGPGSLQVELRNLDAESLAAFYRSLKEAGSQILAQPPEKALQKVVPLGIQSLSALIGKSPEIELTRISLTTEKGDFVGKAKIVFDGSKSPSLENPFSLLTAFMAEAEFNVSERLAHEAVGAIYREEFDSARERHGAALTRQEMDSLTEALVNDKLDKMIEQDLLVKDGGQYKAHATVQAGRMQVNGRRIPLQKLLW
jgi:uncharacterized protein YdgA (DUF945 family)